MSTKMTIIEGLKSSDASSRLQVLFDLEMDQVDHDVIKLMIRLIEEDPAQSVRLEALRRVEELWPNTTVRGFYRQILMDGMLQNAGPVAASLGRIGDDSARVLLLEVYSKASQFAIRWLCFDCLLGSWPYGAVLEPEPERQESEERKRYVNGYQLTVLGFQCLRGQLYRLTLNPPND